MLCSVCELSSRADALLAAGSYAANSSQRYRAVWSAFADFCDDAGIVEPSRDDGAAFLRGLGISDASVLSKEDKHKRRAVELLFVVKESDGLPAPASRGKARPVVPARFQPAMAVWQEHVGGQGLAVATLDRKVFVAVVFLSYLGGTGLRDLSGLQAHHVHQFIGAPDQTMGPSGLAQLREFVRFLAETGMVPAALKTVMPVIHRNRDSSLPSVFTADEVVSALQGIASRSRPGLVRRDRAMFLLAAVLGLRGGDIVDLRFGEIDWSARRLSRIQTKTGHRVDLPIPEQVMLALADYMKHERPPSGDDHVFLLGRAPFGPYRSKATVHVVVSDAFRRAGVDTAGRHHGPHALRHSLASAMLAEGTSYPVIGAVLGHSSKEATRTYLRIDVEQLRRLVLEVPDDCH